MAVERNINAAMVDFLPQRDNIKTRMLPEACQRLFNIYSPTPPGSVCFSWPWNQPPAGPLSTLPPSLRADSTFLAVDRASSAQSEITQANLRAEV